MQFWKALCLKLGFVYPQSLGFCALFDVAERQGPLLSENTIKRMGYLEPTRHFIELLDTYDIFFDLSGLGLARHFSHTPYKISPSAESLSRTQCLI
jgi:hypothetical protein